MLHVFLDGNAFPAFLCCLPLLRREPKSAKGILLANLASGLLLIVCIVFILSSSYNPFIYFRF